MNARRRLHLLTLHVLALSLLALPLAGCQSDSEAFARASAKQRCERLVTCNSPIFADQYGRELDHCIDDVEAKLIESGQALEEVGCEYSPEAARKCVRINRANRTECMEDDDLEISAACERVFTCPAEVEGVDGDSAG
ncbi:MAG: hypothetical protein KC420_05265 [Myxococcales bacterium]|nr:hypothetical protein [Myxococcales bacterium]MCB9566949.1 hypothetical protein [Myxococcales bacterium]MCB9704688.1 hypothetical protein [Myxococcales bacterium]